jgi:hypothetical protein
LNFARYQINSKSDIAERYKENKSPLENHHLSMSLKILSVPETDIFANVEEELLLVHEVCSHIIVKNIAAVIFLNSALESRSKGHSFIFPELNQKLNYAEKNRLMRTSGRRSKVHRSHSG